MSGDFPTPEVKKFHLKSYNPTMNELLDFFKARKICQEIIAKNGNLDRMGYVEKLTHCHAPDCGHEYGKFERILLWYGERFCEKCIKNWMDQAYEHFREIQKQKNA